MTDPLIDSLTRAVEAAPDDVRLRTCVSDPWRESTCRPWHRGHRGADLSHVCDSAAEKALLDSVHTGRPRLMNMRDMYAALKGVRPSTGPWFETARTVVEYSDASGEYEDLREWMKRHRLL